jgi:hypothetical protein
MTQLEKGRPGVLSGVSKDGGERGDRGTEATGPLEIAEGQPPAAGRGRDGVRRAQIKNTRTRMPAGSAAASLAARVKNARVVCPFRLLAGYRGAGGGDGPRQHNFSSCGNLI